MSNNNIKNINDISSLKALMNEVGDVMPLSPEEELTLAEKMAQGDTAAKDLFFKSNFRLVISLAKKMNKGGDEHSLNDLVQSGLIGLWTAVEKYDYKMGFRFSTYASYWINKEIFSEVGKYKAAVKIPEAKRYEANSMAKLFEEHTKLYGEEPGLDCLAEAMGITMEKAKELYDLQKFIFTKRLDDTVKGKDDNDTPIYDTIEDENALSPEEMFIKAETSQYIEETIHKHLNEKQEYILCSRYGLCNHEPKTFAQLGQELNLSKERVRQIAASSEATLGRYLDKDICLHTP